MGTMEILKSLFNVAMVEVIFVIVVFKLILSNYEPPIQQSIQAAICVVIGICFSMAVEQNVHSFMAGIIAAGIGFYGGQYVNELRSLKNEIDEDDKKEE